MISLDRQDKNSFFDNNIPVEIYKELMKHLDEGSATCFGLVNKKAHAAWLDAYEYSSVSLDTKVYPPPGGVTLQLCMVLYSWVPSDLFYDSLNLMFKTNDRLAVTFCDFIEGTEIAIDEEAEEEERERERALEQKARKAEEEREERYYRQQRRLHAGTVAHAYGISGYDSDKEYNSDLESIDEDDEMDVDEEEDEEGDEDDDEMDEDEGDEDEVEVPEPKKTAPRTYLKMFGGIHTPFQPEPAKSPDTPRTPPRQQPAIPDGEESEEDIYNATPPKRGNPTE